MVLAQLPEFASVSMLGWLAAAGVPFLIHLLSKRRFREREWAAMRYLRSAVQKRAKRIRVEQWLLLLVRTLLIILMVLAIAQPLASQMPYTIKVGERVHRVIVLDGSYSMNYRTGDEGDVWKETLQTARTLVESHQTGDGLSLLLMDSPPQAIVGSPTFDEQAFLLELNHLPERTSRAEVVASLERTLSLIEEAKRTNPELKRTEVHFISDLGRSTWIPQGADSPERTRLQELGTSLSREASLVLWNVGSSRPVNHAVVDFRMVDQFATMTEETEFEITLELYGREPETKPLQVLIDGSVVFEEQVSLEPRVPKTVRFGHLFRHGGFHAMEARLQEDRLPLDDHRFLSVEVKESLHVLLVDGRPSGDRFSPNTGFLRIALNPEQGVASTSLFEPEVRPETVLLEAPDLSFYDAIFLCDVGRITASEAKRLQPFVERGGGLLIFLGPQVVPGSYNRWLGPEADPDFRLLPALIGPRISRSEDDEPFKIDPRQYQHPVLDLFRGNPLAGLADTPVYTYHQLDMPQESSAETILDIQGNGPLIVEQTVGEGKVVLIGTTSDTRWNEMPRWHSFVPLVQELLRFALQGPEEKFQVVVDQPLQYSVRTLSADLKATVTTPGNEQEEVNLRTSGAMSHLEFHATHLPGNYQVMWGPPLSQKMLFAVNVDPRESDLRSLSVEEFREEIWPSPITFLTQLPESRVEPGSATAPGFRQQVSWSTGLLYGVLALLLLDTLLGWRFAHHT
ncbi:VWA domain-containing protein [Planctomycetales bacterium 10988]|nr:VWA domain-containing protein [Planctomycetales bacterium 10988]